MTPTHSSPRRPRPTAPVIRAVSADVRPAPASAAASLCSSALSVLTFCLVTFYAAQALRMVIAAVDAFRQ